MKRYKVYIGVFLFLFSSLALLGDNPADGFVLLCNQKINPVGIKADDISLSCTLRQPYEQTENPTFRIVVASSVKMLNTDRYDLWDSGVLSDTDGYRIPYKGIKPEPGQICYWRVQYSCRNKSRWSEIATFVTAPDQPADWSGARWISYENLPASLRVVPGIHVYENPEKIKVGDSSVVPLFRKSFHLKQKVKQAYLYISGLGHYEAYVNGKKIGDRALAPGWTQYDKQVLFNSYDITLQINRGENVLGAIVGNGFHYIPGERYHKLMIAYGYPKMICMVSITLADNSIQHIVTDSDWKTSPSAVTYSSIYGGESYDARKEQAGWNKVGFDDSQWKTVQLAESPAGRLEPELMYPLTVNQTFKPAQQFRVNENCYTIDFGQNASGIISVKLKGNRGDTVRFWPAELLSSDKRANQKASGGPYFFEYVLKGGDEELWQPLFSYYGFRYLMVEGAGSGLKLKGEVSSASLLSCEFLHLRNSAPAMGSFSSSSDLLNRIYSLINWAIRSNMQSVLTDCPHREKLGWLEQSYLMGNSIRYNYDVYHLYRKIIRDMMDAQYDNGLIPDIAPEYVVFSEGFVDSPEWGSAGIWLPWMVYKWYGDREQLREAYPMMVKYVEYLSSKSEGNLLSHGLGDWFDYGPQPPGVAQLTPVALTASAIYYKDVQLLAEIAELIGNFQDAHVYRAKAESIRKAFNTRFYDPVHKLYATGSQTALAMPLCLNIPDADQRQAIVESLKRTIQNDGFALTAGDIGFHFLVEALSNPQLSELLYKMVHREDVPGYGFQLAKGATALTESWPALEEVSNNHLMLGHLMEWFYTTILGISDAPDAVASDKILIQPTPVGDLTHADGYYQSPRGEIRVEWKKVENRFEMNCKVPASTSATVSFPSGFTSFYMQENTGRLLECNQTVEITSGEFHFKAVK